MSPSWMVAVIATFGLLMGARSEAHAQQVFVIEESAIECVLAIGPAPELREMSRRIARQDPGRMVGFVVKLSANTSRELLASFTNVQDSKHKGFKQSRSGSIRLELTSASDALRDGPGATTQTLPRERFMMFTMSEAVVEHLLTQRSRCGARENFDKAPFERLHRGVRATLRGMLDQERR